MNAHEQSIADFRALSRGRRATLAREARTFILQNPGCADNSRYWRTLSARQVREEQRALDVDADLGDAAVALGRRGGRARAAALAPNARSAAARAAAQARWHPSDK